MIILFLICPPSILFNSHEVVVVFFFLFLLPLQSVILGKLSVALTLIPSQQQQRAMAL